MNEMKNAKIPSGLCVRAGAVLIQLSIVVVVLATVVCMSEVWAVEGSASKEIMYPDIWGAELPIPERAYYVTGSPDVYRDRKGDILVIYRYWVEDPENGSPYYHQFESRKVRFEARVYNFFQQRVVATLDYQSDRDARRTYMKAVGGVALDDFSHWPWKLRGGEAVDFRIGAGNCINTLEGRLHILGSSGKVVIEKTLFKLLKKPQLVSTGSDLCFHSPSHGRSYEWAHGQSIQWIRDVILIRPIPLGDGTFLAVNQHSPEQGQGPSRVYRFDNKLNSPYVEALPDHFLTDDLETIRDLITQSSGIATGRCRPHCFPPGSGVYEIMQQRVMEHLWPLWLAKRERLSKTLKEDK